VIFIKSKKQVLFGSGITLLVILLFMPSTVGFMGIVFPDSYAVYQGNHTGGDLESFESVDSDTFDLVALLYYVGSFMWIPIYAYKFGFNAYIPEKGNIGQNNEVSVRFKFQGAAVLHIYIRYTDFSLVQYQESDTGGSFVTKYYATADYKSILKVEFAYSMIGFCGYLWVDQLYVNYGWA
jgi:hypothetical protein